LKRIRISQFGFRGLLGTQVIGGDTMAPSGLYAKLCHAFLVYFLIESNYLRIHWTDFYYFSPNDRYLRECERSGPLFPIPQGTLPWQPILWPNLGICVHSAQSSVWKRLAISPFWFNGARLVTTWRCEHITPVLQKLHWLAIRRRVEFKLACLLRLAIISAAGHEL